MNDDINHLNDHMVHALGRINHLELQVKALAAAVAKLQAQVAQAKARAGEDDEPKQDYYAK